MNYSISHPTNIVECEINLPSSKSLSNRLLIIQALCQDHFEIKNLSNSDDTISLVKALKNNTNTIDIGSAGTSFRFLTSYLSTQKDQEFFLTGTSRLKQRPIKELVKVLRKLGAEITHTETQDSPPLKIKGKKLTGGEISIEGNISSQFISSLLMIGPTLEEGITIKIKGEIVSKSYIEMTLKIMEQYGINYTWEKDTIKISHQRYIGRDYTIESDWSAATFWFEIVALSKKSHIILHGLNENSLQGDIAVRDLFKRLGVESNFREKCLVLKKKGEKEKIQRINLINTPDLYQPLRCTLFGLQKEIEIIGLKTLKYKETNRVLAMNKELKNIKNQINTYEDHRMAMSFSPLSLIFNKIIIKDVEVVSKSYPKFWEDLKKGGFIISSSID